MGDAKNIRVVPITSKQARAGVASWHYSGKWVTNSQLHMGVMYQGVLEGVMQLGPPMVRQNSLALVPGTPWNGMLELNRMAFSAALPRNSESRALGFCMRLLRKQRPDIKWVLSFSDATQCGDGTIYRAAGFVLTGIKKNTGLLRMPDGTVHTTMALRPGTKVRRRYLRMLGAQEDGSGGGSVFLRLGAKPMVGHQLRYIYFLGPSYRAKLSVAPLPYTAIALAGAQMYKGVRRAVSIDSDAATFQVAEGGATPTTALHVLQNDPDGARCLGNGKEAENLAKPEEDKQCLG